MKSFKALLLVGSLLFGTGAIANAQSGWGRDDNRGSWQQRDARDRQKAYQDGLKDGQKDARKNRSNHYNNRYRENDDRRAYDAGYRQGRGNNGNWGNNRYPNGNYPNYPNGNYPNDDRRSPHPFGDVMGRQQGNYPNGGGYGVNLAGQNGYSDGYLAGQKDRSTGHSFRPTENKGYKDADRGQSSSGVSKDQFKQAYRDGFMNGYQRGYYGR
jgi:hypothetical protein